MCAPLTAWLDQGVFAILDSCSELDTVDLTACRGVRITDRRRICEVCVCLCVLMRLTATTRQVWEAARRGEWDDDE